MEVSERYSVIHTKLPREFVLLQGQGCRWRKCVFCDYHNDVSENMVAVNREVLSHVTGVYGTLDVINSGSAMELDEETLQMIARIVKDCKITTLWFEAHWMYRHQLADFAARFSPAKVKFRCGVETFDGELRRQWCKGIPSTVTAQDIAQYFHGVCLLCCTEGESRSRILSDIETARQNFEYFSVNVFCDNSTAVKCDRELARWFSREVYPSLKALPGVEVLLNNTDLGVG